MNRYREPILKPVAIRMAYLVVIFVVVFPVTALLRDGIGLPLWPSLIISLLGTGALVAGAVRALMHRDREDRGLVWPFYGTGAWIIVTIWLAVELFRAFGPRPLVFAALIVWVALFIAVLMPLLIGERMLPGAMYLVAVPVPLLAAFDLGYPLGALALSLLACVVAVSAIVLTRLRGMTFETAQHADNAFMLAFFVLPVALTVLVTGPVAAFLGWNMVLVAALALLLTILASWVPLLMLAHRTRVWRFESKSTSAS